MKKITLLITAALLSCSHLLLAQDSKAERVFKTYKFSLYTGPSFNSLRPVANTATAEKEKYNIAKVKGSVGFSLGLQAEYNINDRYGVFSGVSLDWRGGQISATNVQNDTMGVSIDYTRQSIVKYKLQYLTIPLGLKMKAAQFDKIKVFAQTGIDLGLLLSQKGDYVIRKSDKKIEAEEKVKLGSVAKCIPVNLGWMLGVGGEYELTDKNSVYLTLLYRNGFVDVTTPQSNSNGYKFADGNIRFNSFAIRLGYIF